MRICIESAFPLALLAVSLGCSGQKNGVERDLLSQYLDSNRLPVFPARADSETLKIGNFVFFWPEGKVVALKNGANGQETLDSMDEWLASLSKDPVKPPFGSAGEWSWIDAVLFCRDDLPLQSLRLAVMHDHGIYGLAFAVSGFSPNDLNVNSVSEKFFVVKESEFRKNNGTKYGGSAPQGLAIRRVDGRVLFCTPQQQSEEPSQLIGEIKTVEEAMDIDVAPLLDGSLLVKDLLRWMLALRAARPDRPIIMIPRDTLPN
jgi:hypothetical protein